MPTIFSDLPTAPQSCKIRAVEIWGRVGQSPHTAYSRNIMCQKWEGDCGLWVPNEKIFKKYAESLKKIVGAVWELPAK